MASVYRKVNAKSVADVMDRVIIWIASRHAITETRTNTMHHAIYDEEIRNNKQLLWLCCKLFVRALVAIAPVLPLMFVLGAVDAYIVRQIDSYHLRVVVEILIGIVDGLLWLTALCILHTRFTGHAMPIMKAFKQALRRYPLIFLLVIFYILFGAVFYEIIVFLRYLFSFSDAHYMKYVEMAVILFLGVVYIYFNVLVFLSFLIILIEEHSFWGAIKRSYQLTECGWSKVFLAYAGLYFMTFLVVFPDYFLFARDFSLAQSIGVQIIYAIILIPFWMTWFLMTYNDLKLAHAYEVAEEEVDEEES